jgi:hypothetical protein
MRSRETRTTHPGKRSLAVAATVGALLGLSGCAAIPWPQSPRAGAAAPRGAGLVDLRGVVHVHTSESHDSPGTIDAVVKAAKRAGVSWVALAEHSRPGTNPAEGRVGGITFVPGYEVKELGGSILALGVRENPPEFSDPAQLLDWVHGVGGLAFVGHLERSRLEDPALYSNFQLDGIELINLHAAVRDQWPRFALKMLFLPSSVALRSLLADPGESLDRWSRLPEAWTIIGGVDAHAKFRLLGPVGGTVDRYADMFRLLTTHVLARDAEADSILEALRAGRSYVALEGFGTVDAFLFEPREGGYFVEAPQPARLALVCDGVQVDSVLARRAQLRAPASGHRCRAEAWLDEKLWIVTSYRRVTSAPDLQWRDSVATP